VRIALGIVAVAAVFFGVLGVGMRATGTWDAAVLGVEPTLPPEPSLRPPSWKVHRTSAFSLALPKDWRAVRTNLAGRRELAALRRTNPRLAGLFSDAVVDDPAVRFRAFDVAGSANARRALFVTNLSVRRGRALPSAKASWRADLRSLRMLPGLVGPIRRARLRIPGVAATTFEYGMRLQGPTGKPLELALTQVSIVTGSVEYVVTFTTTRPQAAAYAPVFRRSAASFRLRAHG
jgi:hypothetical protein